MTMLFLTPGLLGWVNRPTGIAEGGAALVLSADGSSLLFASREAAPLRWVPISEFVFDPAAIAETDALRRREGL